MNRIVTETPRGNASYQLFPSLWFTSNPKGESPGPRRPRTSVDGSNGGTFLRRILACYFEQFESQSLLVVIFKIQLILNIF